MSAFEYTKHTYLSDIYVQKNISRIWINCCVGIFKDIQGSVHALANGGPVFLGTFLFFIFIKISKLALPGVMLSLSEASNVERKSVVVCNYS